MAKLPNKKALGSPRSFNSGRAVVSGASLGLDEQGKALSRLGNTLDSVASSLEADEKEEERKRNALDLIRADAHHKTALIEAERGFDNDPDYATYDQRFRETNKTITEQSTGLIRDPELREKWRLQAQVDAARVRDRVLTKGEKIRRETQVIALGDAVGRHANVFSDPTIDPERRDRALSDIRTSITAAERTGLLTPAQGAKFREVYVEGALIDEASNRLSTDPQGLLRDLTEGRPDLDATNTELRARQPDRQRRAAQPVTRFAGNVNTAINDAAEQYGVDPALMGVFAQIESSGKPGVTTGSYKGLFQLSDEEFARHGGAGDIYDARNNAEAAAAKIKRDSAEFEEKYGRAPTSLDLYMIHQQGEGGYQAHTANPDAPAWQNMFSTAEGRQKGERWAKQAIWGNIPNDMKARFGSVDNVTSADFFQVWSEKIERFGGKAGTAVTTRQTLSADGPYAELPPKLRFELIGKANKAIKDAREKIADQRRAEGILSGTLPFDPGSSDDRKLMDKAFAATELTQLLEGGDWTASDQVVHLANSTSYVPSQALETLRGMAVNGDESQRHFAYQTIGSILRQKPGAIETSGAKGFNKAMLDEVETFNTMVMDAGIPAEQAIGRIDEMRSPEFQKRRESLKKEASDIVKELTVEDITREYSGIFTSRPAAGGSDRRASFMLDAYRDMVRYHYARTADPELAKSVALNEMKRAYSVSTITGNKRLMRNRPEQFYPAIPSSATADPSYDYFTDDLKRSVREAAGKEIPVENIYLESNSRTQADIAAGNPYPSYTVVWRQEDENGIPQLLTAPGPFIADVSSAQKKASAGRRKAMQGEREEFAGGSDRREMMRQRREEVAKDPMKFFDNLKEDLVPESVSELFESGAASDEAGELIREQRRKQRTLEGPR